MLQGKFRFALSNFCVRLPEALVLALCVLSCLGVDTRVIGCIGLCLYFSTSGFDTDHAQLWGCVWKGYFRGGAFLIFWLVLLSQSFVSPQMSCTFSSLHKRFIYYYCLSQVIEKNSKPLRSLSFFLLYSSWYKWCVPPRPWYRECTCILLFSGCFLLVLYNRWGKLSDTISWINGYVLILTF